MEKNYIRILEYLTIEALIELRNGHCKKPISKNPISIIRHNRSIKKVTNHVRFGGRQWRIYTVEHGRLLKYE